MNGVIGLRAWFDKLTNRASINSATMVRQAVTEPAEVLTNRASTGGH